MKLGEIYRHKENDSIIQIDSFASHINGLGTIIVYRHIEKHNNFEMGCCLSFNGYGSKEEIESKYELLLSQEELSNCSDWNEIFKLVEHKQMWQKAKENRIKLYRSGKEEAVC